MLAQTAQAVTESPSFTPGNIGLIIVLFLAVGLIGKVLDKVGIAVIIIVVLVFFGIIQKDTALDWADSILDWLSSLVGRAR